MSGPKRYLPSNSTDGEAFTERFCLRCVHGAWDRDPDGQAAPCPITLDTTCNVQRDEWTYDDRGRPTCTAFTHVPDDGTGRLDDPRQPPLLVLP